MKPSSVSTFEAAADRIRVLNERVIESSSKAGVAGLQVYGRLLQRLAESQEHAGKHGSQWLIAFGQAQATFSRDLAHALPAAARTVGARAASATPSKPSKPAKRRSTAASANGRLPIANYDKLTVKQLESRLKRLSKPDLRTVDAYERKHKNRATVLKTVASLRS